MFAPNSKYRAAVTCEATKKKQPTFDVALDYEMRHSKMNWAMRLQRIFNIDVTTCSDCQGRVRIIACIEERAVINTILAHLKQQKNLPALVPILSCICAPPAAPLSKTYN